MSAFESATRISAGQALTAEDIAAAGLKADEPVARYALRLADDSLILAQQLSWWISRAPEIEEDIALGNIALDTLGHARSFYTYAGTAWGKTEDDLAYHRDEGDFVCAHLVQVPNGDFGQTIARQLLFSIYATLLYEGLAASSDPTLAAVAAKAVKEVEYHVDHAWQWTLRLGMGTQESAQRMQAGLNIVWPYLEELFEDDELIEELPGVAVRPSTLREPALAAITRAIREAQLEIPTTKTAVTGGRKGLHRESLGFILAEMQVLARAHPGATW
ncbi:1,2-phenylacetyl-CoA epoxidase subunit PaaC [Gephyromycinifex aptenodytis]|uniref:1,2-phenylacetyl-CoA epoxidase subunit PaaC n=1 Tax=Gephyromycinifex aptenodytis TaxID=2716227 RepID=UPI001446937E|nr:1,2-phenylacetyl-CoA epoxidase subunit PaaC [Gephyromycinifex aptenodytis]